MKIIFFAFYLFVLSSSKLFSQDSSTVNESLSLRPEVHVLFGGNTQIDGFTKPYLFGIRGCLETPFVFYAGGSFYYLFGSVNQYVKNNILVSETPSMTLALIELGISLHVRKDFSFRIYSIVGAGNESVKYESSEAIIFKQLDDISLGGGMTIHAILNDNWLGMIDAKGYTGSGYSVGFLATLGVGYRF